MMKLDLKDMSLAGVCIQEYLQMPADCGKEELADRAKKFALKLEELTGTEPINMPGEEFFVYYIWSKLFVLRAQYLEIAERVLRRFTISFNLSNLEGGGTLSLFPAMGVNETASSFKEQLTNHDIPWEDGPDRDSIRIIDDRLSVWLIFEKKAFSKINITSFDD